MYARDLPRYNPDFPVTANPDEKCFAILETDLQTEDGKLHRHQIIDFLRGNTPLRQVRDLVAEGEFTVLDQHPPLQVYCALEETVGHAMELAQQARDRKKVRDTMSAMAKTSTLIQDAITQAEIKTKILRKQSQFGPGKIAGTQRT